MIRFFKAMYESMRALQKMSDWYRLIGKELHMTRCEFQQLERTVNVFAGKDKARLDEIETKLNLVSRELQEYRKVYQERNAA